MLGHQMDDPRMLGLRRFPLLPGMVPPKSRYMGLPSIKQEIPLLLDASNTLFVEGLPAFCTRREVSRILLSADYIFMYFFVTLFFILSSVVRPSFGLANIFLPFVGFKEVRLVSKESRHVSESSILVHS